MLPHQFMCMKGLYLTLLLANALPWIAHGEIDRVELFREITAYQADPHDVYIPHGAYSAQARVVADAGHYREGFLNFPSGFFLAFSYEDGRWMANANYVNPDGPFSGYPEGNYTFSFERGSTWVSWTLRFGGGHFPRQPKLTNYADTQEIVPTQPLELSWEPWAEALPGDVIEIEIVDETDGVPEMVFLKGRTDATPLAGTATGFTVPTGNLVAGRHYVLYVRFVRTLLAGTNLIQPEPNTPVHLGNIASTGVALRFLSEGEREVSFNWSSTYEQIWQTAGDFSLSPLLRFTDQVTYRALFSTEDWFNAPAQQVKFWGPEGSGLISSPANFSSYTRRGITYHATLGYFGTPPIGEYQTQYKGQTYLFPDTTPPSTDAILYLYPTIHVDAEGLVTRISWEYFRAADGAEAGPPAGLQYISLWVQGVDDTVYYDESTLSPNTTSVDFGQNGPEWEKVANIQATLMLAHGDDYVSRYWINHMEHPSLVYFDGGNYYDGWCQSQWYGWLYAGFWPWIYHMNHGWQFAHGPGELSVILYDVRLGWLWTKAGYYPFIYRFADGKWYWFDQTTSAPIRRFRDFSDGGEGTWKYEDDIAGGL